VVVEIDEAPGVFDIFGTLSVVIMMHLKFEEFG
jgi:hypothetical protein